MWLNGNNPPTRKEGLFNRNRPLVIYSKVREHIKQIEGTTIHLRMQAVTFYSLET